MPLTWQGPAAPALEFVGGTSLALTAQPREVDVAGVSQGQFAATRTQSGGVTPGQLLVSLTASLQGAGQQLDLRAA